MMISFVINTQYNIGEPNDLTYEKKCLKVVYGFKTLSSICNSAMVILPLSIYKEVVGEIIRWNNLLVVDIH